MPETTNESLTEAQTIAEFYEHMRGLTAAPTRESAIGLADTLMDRMSKYTTTINGGLLKLIQAQTSKAPESPEWKAISEIFVLIDMVVTAFTLTNDSLAFSPLAAANEKKEVQRSKLVSMIAAYEAAGEPKSAEQARETLRKLQAEEDDK